MKNDPQNQEIQDRISIPMSDADLERYTGVTPDKVIKYSELINYKTIEELLPTDKSFRIILLEQRPRNGHWVTVLRYGKTIEVFDSYGGTIDNELKYIPEVMKRMLGEDKKHLGRLLKAVEDRQVIYSKKRLQKLKGGINTCGRWVILRILMMKQFFYTLNEFLAFIDNAVKDTSFTPDELVATWIT
jgi:hypothetical protein